MLFKDYSIPILGGHSLWLSAQYVISHSWNHTHVPSMQNTYSDLCTVFLALFTSFLSVLLSFNFFYPSYLYFPYWLLILWYSLFIFSYCSVPSLIFSLSYFFLFWKIWLATTWNNMQVSWERNRREIGDAPTLKAGCDSHSSFDVVETPECIRALKMMHGH